MAKMGNNEIYKLRSSILNGLYYKREDALKVRRAAIAEKNRELQLAPIQYLLDQLPTDMIAHADEYVVRIRYTRKGGLGGVLVDEKWDYKTDTPVINPQKVSNSHYQNTPDNDLKEELKEEADKLCEDIIELKTEKEEMSVYLNATTRKYTGSLQLRKAWKNEPALLKYLPAEPVKVLRPKPAKKEIKKPNKSSLVCD